MTRTSAAVISTLLGLTTALFACSSAEGPADPCVKNPKAKGCTAAAAPATTASTYASTPVPNVPPPPAAIDAGSDAPHKPEAGTLVPPANATSCNDLLKCCSKINDGIERAGCMLIAYNGDLDYCTASVVACESGVLNTGGSGSGGGGGGGGSSDPCSGFSSQTRSNGQNDYTCCVYGYQQAYTECCGNDGAGCRE